MKRIPTTCFVVALAFGSSLASAQEMPDMPKPQKEHEFLNKFVGEWDTEMKAEAIPGMPAMECTGTQKARMLGGFWIVSEGKGEMMGQPIESIMQLGYDAKKKRYVGTWSDSCNDHMWKYEGTVDGETLTLNTEGPNMMEPEKMSNYREVIDFKSPDHYTFTSSIEGEDGKWTTFMTADFKKKK